MENLKTLKYEELIDLYADCAETEKKSNYPNVEQLELSYAAYPTALYNAPGAVVYTKVIRPDTCDAKGIIFSGLLSSPTTSTIDAAEGIITAILNMPGVDDTKEIVAFYDLQTCRGYRGIPSGCYKFNALLLSPARGKLGFEVKGWLPVACSESIYRSFLPYIGPEETIADKVIKKYPQLHRQLIDIWVEIEKRKHAKWIKNQEERIKTFEGKIYTPEAAYCLGFKTTDYKREYPDELTMGVEEIRKTLYPNAEEKIVVDTINHPHLYNQIFDRSFESRRFSLWVK